MILWYVIYNWKSKIYFILYLAVDENVRSNGYGSKILNLVKSGANGKNVDMSSYKRNCYRNYSLAYILRRLKLYNFLNLV